MNKSKRENPVQFRVVGLIGKKSSNVRKVHKSNKSVGYSLSVVLPSTLAKQLSLSHSDIVKFHINTKNQLVLEKVSSE
jgi:hypothetical protein